MVDKTPAELDPGTPSDTSIVHASENGVSTNSKGHGERDISRLQGTAPSYSSSKTYNLNDLVTESGDVFRNTIAIAVPETFNPTKWSVIGTGEVNTASNVGTGVGVFKLKNVFDLEFKSLLANTEILIASNVDDLAFSIGAIAISKITGLQTDLDSKIDAVVNVGTGAGLIFRDIVGQTANLKSLIAGTNITVTNNADDITIDVTSTGEVNTASNLGGGEGVFAQKNGVDLEFKSLVAGDNISLTSDANEITITGEDITIDVRNISGSLISKGSTVYITGASGNNVTVDLALASGTSTIPSIGIVLDDIANNSNGKVVNAGKITNLDTSSFSVGDTLFVSALTAGDLTSTAPLHPNLRQSMAVVLVSNVTIGEIQVLTGDVSGAESGTILNTFKIGDNLAGTKILEFDNGFSQQISATPTVNRVQTLQDLDGTIALLADIPPPVVVPPSVVIQNVNTEVATTADDFFAFSGSDPDSSTELNTENIFPVPVKVQNVCVRVSSQSPNASTVVTRKNNVDGNALITIPGATTGTFRDTVNSDDYGIADTGNYKVNAGAGGTMTVVAFGQEIVVQ